MEEREALEEGEGHFLTDGDKIQGEEWGQKALQELCVYKSVWGLL